MLGPARWSSRFPASAQRIENSVAVFAALDKVTAKISRLEVPLNQTATFGALKVTPRACYSRAPTEPPKTTTFVEVEEIQLDGKQKKIFSGWMFADSPGLNAVEHPVFDVWLTDCSQPRATAQRPPPPPLRHPARLRHRRRPPIPTTPSPSDAAACRGSLVSDRRAGSGGARACLGNRRLPDVVAVDPGRIDSVLAPGVLARGELQARGALEPRRLVARNASAGSPACPMQRASMAASSSALAAPCAM